MLLLFVCQRRRQREVFMFELFDGDRIGHLEKEEHVRLVVYFFFFFKVKVAARHIRSRLHLFPQNLSGAAGFRKPVDHSSRPFTTGLHLAALPHSNVNELEMHPVVSDGPITVCVCVCCVFVQEQCQWMRLQLRCQCGQTKPP